MDLTAVQSHWRLIMSLIIPVALLPLTFMFEQDVSAARCAYVLIIMAVFWVFELLPLPITGLFPAILLPLLGVQMAKEVVPNYFQDSVLLLIGGILVALGVENTNLHKRVALRVLLFVGAKPHWIMAGFMGITAGLSMFISNTGLAFDHSVTATTAMILPIAVAVVMELNRHKKGHKVSAFRAPIWEKNSISFTVNPDNLPPVDRFRDGRKRSRSLGLIPNSSAVNLVELRDKAEELGIPADVDFATLSARQQDISKALVLCIAYASGIGGMATLTGTLTNVVFVAAFREAYPASDVVNYATFVFYGLPTMVLCLVFAFCWLTFFFFILPSLRSKNSDSESDPQMEEDMKQMFRTKYDDLGPITFAEGSVIVIFLCLVFMWFFRAPGFFPGWETAFKPHYVSDSTPAALLALILFLWPSQCPKFRKRAPGEKVKHYQPILTWSVVAQKFPWDVVLLLGGALALAKGVQVSGLTEIIKSQMQEFSSVPTTLMCALIAFFVATCTEFASNSAVASISLPVVAKLAEVTNVHPLYYMLPVTLSCSFAFMSPVATPSNTIVFSSGFLKLRDIVTAGAVVNLGCMGIMLGTLHTVGYWVFDLEHYPSWAPSVNMTANL